MGLEHKGKGGGHQSCLGTMAQKLIEKYTPLPATLVTMVIYLTNDFIEFLDCQGSAVIVDVLRWQIRRRRAQRFPTQLKFAQPCGDVVWLQNHFGPHTTVCWPGVIDFDLQEQSSEGRNVVPAPYSGVKFANKNGVFQVNVHGSSLQIYDLGQQVQLPANPTFVSKIELVFFCANQLFVLLESGALFSLSASSDFQPVIAMASIPINIEYEIFESAAVSSTEFCVCFGVYYARFDCQTEKWTLLPGLSADMVEEKECVVFCGRRLFLKTGSALYETKGDQWIKRAVVNFCSSVPFDLSRANS